MMNLARFRERLAGISGPFALVTTDGRSLSVPHEDYLTVGQGLLIITHDDESRSAIDPLHIVSIEEPGLPTSPTSSPAAR